MTTKPPVSAALVWQGDLRFSATSGQSMLAIDSKGEAGPSPVQSLVLGLAGCMAVDVVDIVRKGRHELQSLEATLVATRADEPPRRLTAVTLHFTVGGPVPEAAVARAIELSREKYCSVWHSLRQDIAFETTFEIRP